MADTVLATKFAAAIGAPFLDTFRHQYAISDHALALEDFTQRRLGSFFLYHSPELPFAELFDRNGTRIGCVLGYAIDVDGRLYQGDVTLDVSVGDAAIMDRLDGIVQTLSGRHVVLLSVETGTVTQSRLYLDAIGALGAIYDPTTRICASTLLLALNRDIEPHPVFAVSPAIRAIPEFDGLLPSAPDNALNTTGFGQSFDARARQLLSNHYLDLNDFTAHRSPLRAPSEAERDPDAAADAIVARLRSNLSALSTDGSGYLAISGGLDSRMMVAAAPKGLEDRIQYYSYSDNWITEVDVRIAQELAADMGTDLVAQSPDVGHSYFPRSRRSQFFQMRCAVSSGLKSLGDTWWANGYFRKLTPGALWLRGNALEVVSARLWTPTVKVSMRKARRHALRRLGVMSEDRSINEVMKQCFLDWASTLPDHALPVMPDFWYQELFLSHSQSLFHGLNDLAYVPPASDRAIFDAARAVDPTLRRTHVLYDAIIKAGRPSLATIPTTRELTKLLKSADMNIEDAMLTVKEKRVRHAS